MRWWSFIWLFLALVSFSEQKDFSPKISILTRKRISSDVVYFDDSSNILGLSKDGELSMSFDDGAKWQVVEETKGKKIVAYEIDPFVKTRGFAFTDGKDQFVTQDSGKSWKKFQLVDSNKKPADMDSEPHVIFHAQNPDLALIDYYSCPHKGPLSAKCKRKHYYTTDGFKSSPKELPTDAEVCRFLRSTKDFQEGKEEALVCSLNDVNSFGHIVESTIISSDDFFKTLNKLSHKKGRSGSILDIKVESDFIIAVIQNDKFNRNSKVSMLVSKDGKNFHEADVHIDVAYGVMTFLESSPSALFLSVLDYSSHLKKFSLSTVYKSDSSGLRFSKILDRVQGNSVEKVLKIDGVWIANRAEEESDEKEHSLLDMLMGGGLNANIKTKMSFDDGVSWLPLKVTDDNCKVDDGCSLHLLSPNERDGSGKFVTGPVPGIMMGVGSTGDHLDKSLHKMLTWISRDGGATWSSAIDTPCLFSFGDQGNVIFAVPYYGKEKMSTDVYYYSTDQGKTWEKGKLEKPIYPLIVSSMTDATAAKFILTGIYDDTPENENDSEFSEVVYALDFSDAFGGKVCNKNDFEEFYARVNDKGDPICIYGHKEKFKRRKQDAQCFVNKIYEDLETIEEPCECIELDFECGEGFELHDGKCVENAKKIGHMCRHNKAKELSLANKVKIDGTKCKMGKKSESDFVLKQTFKCSDYVGHGHNHEGGGTDLEINSELNTFDANLRQYTYLEQGEDYTGENVVMLTDDDSAYISNDGGIHFKKVPVNDRIKAYHVGFVPGQLILVTDGDTIYVSDDGGNSFVKRRAPTDLVNLVRLISFHKTDPHKYIWYGGDCGGKLFDCEISAYITKDDGQSFDKLLDNVVTCDFVSPFLEEEKVKNKDLIYCTVRNKSGTLKLVSSTTNFKDSKTLHENIVGYAISGKFVIVASIDEKAKSLKAKVTVDGETFADADFPHNFHVAAQEAYTVLDSVSQAVFIHITTNNERGKEYGSILKSNSNGTDYVLSLDRVNRNEVGYVDYDRIEGIEGLMIANVVSDTGNSKEKSLKTKMTHDDGAEWNYIVPPTTDSKGKKYPCSGQLLQKCSLNLHGYTERPDYRDTFSSSSAIGLMIGVGNVGEKLTSYEDGSTFLTRDGGNTWKEVKKGRYMWEYGDRGTILILVKADEPTNSLSYSLDEGNKWHDYKFAEDPIHVLDLATVPSDTSRKFLIFGTTKSHKRTLLSYSIDFTNIHKRQCQIDLDNPDSDDFEYWSPNHPESADKCLFGHEAKYLRRAEGHNDCFIGSAPLKEGFKMVRNCSCTRRDFECDYNYFMDTDKTCKLVPGLSPSDRKKDMCLKENAFEYTETTGYRKIPISTCEGGKRFDGWQAHPCPGKEKEYNKHYGKELTGGNLFAILFVPLAVFFFATWIVYDRGIRRNGGLKRLGQIRLDADDDDFQPIENNQLDKVVNTIVRGGIIVVAGALATFKPLRQFDRFLFDKVTFLLFSRRPSGRNFVRIPDAEDEDELFGEFRDNYEEELEEGIDVNFNQDDHDTPPVELEVTEHEVTNPDTRLFDIDDPSDEERSESTTA